MEVSLAKVPFPLDVHFKLELLAALEPAVMFIAPEFEQVETAVPATAVGAGDDDNVSVEAWLYLEQDGVGDPGLSVILQR